jgi:hypothetical protein
MEVAHVWDWFLDLAHARSVGYTANPISYVEIEAYARLYGLDILPIEVALLRRLDMAALAHVASKRRNTGDKEPKNLTDASDVHGVKTLFKRLSAKANKGGTANG